MNVIMSSNQLKRREKMNSMNILVDVTLRPLGGVASAVAVLFSLLALIILALILIGLPTAQPKNDDSKGDK